MRKRKQHDLDVPAAFAPDILAQVHKDFGAQASEALATLATSLPEARRVLRCVVFLAHGRLDELAALVTAAKTDYRDVIFWAEYTNHAAENPRKVRDFNRPFLHAGSVLPAEHPRLGKPRRRGN